METFHILLAGLTAIILFVFGLESFSREVEKISGERLRKSLSGVTRIPIVGVAIGAFVTAVIQSSSATSVITISLVNAGVLSFKNSVGIIFGSNIGTTITAQLVAFKLTAFAPAIIIIGFVLSIVRSRYAVFGRAIFFFGFVFFSLNLISSSLQPLQSHPKLIEFLSEPQNPFYALLFGCLFTAIVQSSSVTTGLAIIFTQQGMLGLENAVPIIMGSNIGTTVTAMLAIFNMDASAKKTGLSHLLFNLGGVLIFLPVLLLFGSKLGTLNVDPAIALANIHLIFNVATSVIFIALMGPFIRLVDLFLGEGKMDFERLTLPVEDQELEFDSIMQALRKAAGELLAFLEENYNQVTLSIESNYVSIFNSAGKRIEYIEFVKKEYLGYFSRVVTKINGETESKELVRVINQFDYLFQVHDSINDLFNTRRVMSENFIELKSDILLLTRGLSSQTLALFESLKKGIEQGNLTEAMEMAKETQASLDGAQKQLLSLLADPERRDAGSMINLTTYSQRLKDKLVNYGSVALGLK